MDCVIRDGVCVHCGWKWAGDPAVHRTCKAPGAESGERGTIELRGEEEQAALAAICRTNACGHYDAAADACRKCGCNSERRERWLSKLRIGDCPLRLWPKAGANKTDRSDRSDLCD
jgi:hypothetical protein